MNYLIYRIKHFEKGKNMNKKLLLSLGTVAAVATPIVAVVSCGSDDKEEKASEEVNQTPDNGEHAGSGNENGNGGDQTVDQKVTITAGDITANQVAAGEEVVATTNVEHVASVTVDAGTGTATITYEDGYTGPGTLLGVIVTVGPETFDYATGDFAGMTPFVLDMDADHQPTPAEIAQNQGLVESATTLDGFIFEFRVNGRLYAIANKGSDFKHLHGTDEMSQDSFIAAISEHAYRIFASAMNALAKALAPDEGAAANGQVGSGSGPDTIVSGGTNNGQGAQPGGAGNVQQGGQTDVQVTIAASDITTSTDDQGVITATTTVAHVTSVSVVADGTATITYESGYTGPATLSGVTVNAYVAPAQQDTPVDTTTTQTALSALTDSQLLATDGTLKADLTGLSTGDLENFDITAVLTPAVDGTASNVDGTDGSIVVTATPKTHFVLSGGESSLTATITLPATAYVAPVQQDVSVDTTTTQTALSALTDSQLLAADGSLKADLTGLSTGDLENFDITAVLTLAVDGTASNVDGTDGSIVVTATPKTHFVLSGGESSLTATIALPATAYVAPVPATQYFVNGDQTTAYDTQADAEAAAIITPTQVWTATGVTGEFDSESDAQDALFGTIHVEQKTYYDSDLSTMTLTGGTADVSGLTEAGTTTTIYVYDGNAYSTEAAAQAAWLADNPNRVEEVLYDQTDVAAWVAPHSVGEVLTQGSAGAPVVMYALAEVVTYINDLIDADSATSYDVSSSALHGGTFGTETAATPDEVKAAVSGLQSLSTTEVVNLLAALGIQDSASAAITEATQGFISTEVVKTPAVAAVADVTYTQADFDRDIAAAGIIVGNVKTAAIPNDISDIPQGAVTTQEIRTGVTFTDGDAYVATWAAGSTTTVYVIGTDLAHAFDSRDNLKAYYIANLQADAIVQGPSATKVDAYGTTYVDRAAALAAVISSIVNNGPNVAPLSQIYSTN